ncbi:MAG: YicC family protein [Bacteroidales bacterium]|nr:YicC family protein [Candidatus Cryptobacteroides aphodequi]
MMIKSMTGYGKAEAMLEGGKLRIEFRSVNSKSADISIKSSLLPKEHEMAVRKKIADKLQRGTIDMFITWEPNAGASAKSINTDLALEYYAQMLELKKLLRITSPGEVTQGKDEFTDIMSLILRMPEVMDSGKQDVITEDNWPAVEKAIDEALEAIDHYRSDEGVSLYKDVTGRVATILSLYDEIEQYEPERIASIKEKITKAAEECGVKLEKERFEQEMIFYLEKLDINEEKVRLRQHCKYFMDTIDGEPFPGKKLGFIIQEMGREINTTGSKSNNAEMQKRVVKMKDELEKIREQSMNIL